MTNTPASATPNVVIENPAVRRTVRTVLDVIGGGAFIAAAVDQAAPGFDIGSWTIPILAGYTVARVVFGFAVDSPNTPKH